jgi:Ner family transcriptional regulator
MPFARGLSTFAGAGIIGHPAAHPHVLKYNPNGCNFLWMHPVDIKTIPSDPKIRREWIKYQLAIRGHTLSTLAKQHNRTRQQPQAALRKPYPKWERIIADALGIESHHLWPERYDADGAPARKKGRGRSVMTQEDTTRPAGKRKTRVRHT